MSNRNGKGPGGLVSLRPSVRKNRHIKARLSGRAGTGKTMTASLLTIGAMEASGQRGPVAWFATEPGIDYVLPLFEQAGIACSDFRPYELPQADREQWGDFALFEAFLADADAIGAQAVIVDSISHVWADFARRHGPPPNSLPSAWARANAVWGAAMDRLATAPFHAAVCARAGDEWGEVGGKLAKTGEDRAKIKEDSNFEFSLILEMRRQGPDVVARIKKERSLAKNQEGREIKNPQFSDFAEVWRHMAWSVPEAAPPPAQRARADIFEALELREGWSWPASAEAYQGPHDPRREREDKELRLWFARYHQQDKEAGDAEGPNAKALECARAGIAAGWTPKEFDSFFWADKWEQMGKPARAQLRAWLRSCADARAQAFEMEGAAR